MLWVGAAAIILLMLWLRVRSRQRTARLLLFEAENGQVIPVRSLTRIFFPLSYSQNSISPRFEVLRDGLRFKVFKPDYWPLQDIKRVDAPQSLLATRIAFAARTEGTLFVDVVDKAKGRELLRGMPQNLVFTPRSVEMRDGAGPTSSRPRTTADSLGELLDQPFQRELLSRLRVS